MNGLADVDGFKNLQSCVHVAGFPTPANTRHAHDGFLIEGT